MGVDSYKRQHKPLNESKTKYKQGYFQIPENYTYKYVGDPTQIIYRSSLEYKWCLYCCKNPQILRWSSEPIAIPYFNPLKFYKAKINTKKNQIFEKELAIEKSKSNYYVDFWVEVKRDDGTIRKAFIEIKPHAQTIEPIHPGPDAKLKDIRAYNKAAETFIVNVAKWKAAKEYCDRLNCDFLIVTEKTLKGLRLVV